MQLLLAFRFSLSATKEVVNTNLDKAKLSQILGDVQVAKLLLTGCVGIALVILTACIPILRANILFVALSFLNVVIMEMLADFLFRSIDRMEVLTIRFVVSKLVSTVCIFIFIRNDAHLMLISVFVCIGSVAVFVLVLVEKKRWGCEWHHPASRNLFGSEVLQVAGLAVLIALDQFVLTNIALLRGATELLMLALRFSVCMRYKHEYNP